MLVGVKTNTHTDLLLSAAGSVFQPLIYLQCPASDGDVGRCESLKVDLHEPVASTPMDHCMLKLAILSHRIQVVYHIEHIQCAILYMILFMSHWEPYVHFSCVSSMALCLLVHHFGPEWNMLISIKWVPIKSCAGIQDPQWMNSIAFGDPLTFTVKYFNIYWKVW